MSTPILVTGATGRHGGTGAHLVRRLREADRPVRVLARQRGERTAPLEALGAEIVGGDLHDHRSLVAALAGVEIAYFTYPIADGVVSAAASFAAAAREVGALERVVVMSMGAADPSSPSHLGRAQWLAEEVLRWAGLRCTILRVAAFFYENLLALHAAQVRSGGPIRNSFAGARIPWIAGEDAADLAVTAILHPGRFDGGEIHYPPGAALHSHAEIAALLTEELGREIRYEAIDAGTWAAELGALAAADGAGLINADMARHISALGAALARTSQGPRRAPDPHELTRLTGRPITGMREFLHASRAQLTGATDSAP